MFRGDRLKALRLFRDITQEELAKVFKISKGNISRYETGIREPDSDLLSDIAKFFDVTTDYLLGNTDNPKPIREMYEQAGAEFSPERGYVKEEISKKLQDLDIQYLQLAKKMKKENVDPKAVDKLIEVLKKNKKALNID